MESALDRFARTRGAALLGATALARQGKLQAIIGGGLLAVGAVVAMIPLLGAPAEAAYGAIGPAIAGTVNLSLGLAFRASARRQRVHVALSDDAMSLLRALVARAQVWQGGWRPRHAPMQGPHAWPGYKAPVAPPASAMDALERAAEAHNRIMDALGDAKDERSARLRVAADAGIGEALHQAATQATDSAGIEGTVARLTELAELTERSVARVQPESVLRSNLEATLEELRAEDVARRELLG